MKRDIYGRRFYVIKASEDGQRGFLKFGVNWQHVRSAALVLDVRDATSFENVFEVVAHMNWTVRYLSFEDVEMLSLDS